MPPATYENFDVLIGRVAIDYQTRLLVYPCRRSSNRVHFTFFRKRNCRVSRTLEWCQPPALALHATWRRFDARAFSGPSSTKRRLPGRSTCACSAAWTRQRGAKPACVSACASIQSLDGAANLPWELLYVPSLGRFLAQSDLTPIVRYVESPRPVQPLQAHPPLIVLAIIANPQICPHWLWNRNGGPCKMHWRIWSALAWLFSNGWNLPRYLHCRPVCAEE